MWLLRLVFCAPNFLFQFEPGNCLMVQQSTLYDLSDAVHEFKLCTTALCCTTINNTSHDFIALHCTIHYCTALHCTALLSPGGRAIPLTAGSRVASEIYPQQS